MTAKKVSVKSRAISLADKKNKVVVRKDNPIKNPPGKYVVYFETGARGSVKKGYVSGDGKYDTEIKNAKPFFSELAAYKEALNFCLSYSNIVGIVEVKKY